MTRKVLHVCVAGVAALRLLLPQCRYLRNAGYDVEMAFPPDSESARTLRDLGFRVHEVPISRRIDWQDLSSTTRLVGLFRRVEPDIVHTHNSKSGVVGRVAARLAGVPNVMHTIHGFPFIEGQTSLKHNAYVIAERTVARWTDLLLSQSLEDVHAARRLGIRARNGYPIHIGNGIDVSRFDPEKWVAKRHDVRAELGLGSQLIVTMVGRLTFEKGYRELIAALTHISDLEWTALLIGEDEGAGSWISDRCREWGLSDRVRLMGARADIERYLAVSDVFVLPSYREGLPRSVIEAQAMQLPAVVTDIRGSREVVKRDLTGLIIPPRNVEGLANGLRSLLSNDGLRAKMGLAARDRVLRLFDEEKVFGRITDSYESLLERS